MISKSQVRNSRALLTGFLAFSIAASAAFGQAIPGPDSSGQQPPAAAYLHPRTVASNPTQSVLNPKAIRTYRVVWGIDNIVVRSVSSGALIRFSYRVVEADKAQMLNDKKMTPYLVDETTNTALQVPAMEQVGQLRQTDVPQNGREYFMVFSNKRGYVKPGNRVDIVIGNFRINGLVVQ